jgi:hypothetical protein
MSGMKDIYPRYLGLSRGSFRAGLIPGKGRKKQESVDARADRPF